MKSFFILMIGIGLFLLFSGFLYQDVTQKEDFSDRVNLALRQVGHKMLSLNGNTKSPIAPIEREHQLKYRLMIDDEIKYDTLPYLLDQALDDFNLPKKYYTAVKDCASDSIVLGFNFTAVSSGQMACRGREQEAGCNAIVVTFTKEEVRSKWSTGLSALLCCIGFIGLLRVRKEAPPIIDPGDLDTSSILLGNTQFDSNNQWVLQNEEKVNLTFREAKLLAYFFNRPNRVLKREDILSDVWGDEGIIVGRSLDVFISRLRKILKPDTSLKIKSVHGVGYRLDVQ